MNYKHIFFLISYASIILGNSSTFVAVYWSIGQSGSASFLATTVAFVFLIRFIVSSLLSKYIDKYNHIYIYIYIFILRILIILITVFLIYSFNQYIVQFLFILTLLLNSLDVVSNTIMPKFIKGFGDKVLVKMNSYISIIEKSFYVFGMLLGAVLITLFNVQIILLIEGALYLLSLLLINFIKNYLNILNANALVKSDSDLYREKSNLITHIVVIAVSANIMITPYTTLIIPFIKNVFGNKPLLFSTTELSIMIGSILVGIFISYINSDNDRSYNKIFIVSALLQGFVILALNFNSQILIYHFLLIILGLCITSFNIPLSILLQKNIDMNKLGGAKAKIVSISTVFSSLSYFLSALLIKYVSINIVFIIFPVIGIFILVIYLVIGGKNGISTFS